MDGVTLPSGLQSMVFGYSFKQSLAASTLPVGLKSLTLHGNHNCRVLKDVTLPAGLQTLALLCAFKQRLNDIFLPAGLQSLSKLEGRRASGWLNLARTSKLGVWDPKVKLRRPGQTQALQASWKNHI